MGSKAPSAYGYTPSIPLAIVGAVIFSVAAGYHVYLYVRQRTWFFHMMLVGVLAEAAGYCARAYSAAHPTDPASFLIGYCTLILAPSFLAAACYMTFGRIVWLVTPPERRSFSALWVPAEWITPLFVTFDIGSFFVQLLGVATVGAAYSSVDTGSPVDTAQLDRGMNVLTFGLVVQLLCFGIFAVIGTRFMVVSRGWTCKVQETKRPWRALAWVVNGSASVITVRGIYRVFEFSKTATHSDNYLTSHEWPFWICDTLPILVVLVLFMIVHPGHSLPAYFTRPRLNKRALNVQAGGAPMGIAMTEFRILNPDSVKTYRPPTAG